ncbi:DUF2254 domain-containing protein [Mycobacterium parmense]|uniref:Uncharacterized protein n=1 Tax=Mycobacterium parmense TaxID=185642 RepID=A0A7I7YZ63_9MYCO|nr:DUF2254 domain-containing protein [Mycobacterium parmense]MCV7350360.1 DUF2254 domain-containing protein [Mycobacterium parmense]ORW59667.1 hypothetical protein AWC20_00460 [Mycobacterium parmense]BBZ47106.1 hypothetical protein MPRM_43870 [Mycobacterium parmense]
MPGYAYLESDWRKEAIRTNLWVLPTAVTAAALVIFGFTYAADRAAYDGNLQLPSWVLSGTSDAARIVLTTIAAALITVVGIVFSITIVSLTLASTQFGPRILRNFVRDQGTQITLGAFVATFCYAMITLVSVSGGPRGDFVPHLSITVALAMTLVDVGVLIYFLNHIATMIQLPVVIAVIAGTLAGEIASAERGASFGLGASRGPSADEILAQIDESGAEIRTPRSGYLQVIRNESLLRVATSAEAVIHLPYRPGHFLVAGQVMARVWPASAASYVEQNLVRGHVTGPYRTLTQDISFGFDQLVEIALRALSPAVNDTFTALTCIDWLGDCLCRISTSWRPQRIRRDATGHIRVIAYQADFDRLVERAFEKIRQCSDGMPAVMIRQLESLAKIIDQTPDCARRATLLSQAERIHRAGMRSVAEVADRDDVTRRYEAIRAMVCPEHPA